MTLYSMVWNHITLFNMMWQCKMWYIISIWTLASDRLTGTQCSARDAIASKDISKFIICRICTIKIFSKAHFGSKPLQSFTLSVYNLHVFNAKKSVYKSAIFSKIECRFYTQYAKSPTPPCWLTDTKCATRDSIASKNYKIYTEYNVFIIIIPSGHNVYFNSIWWTNWPSTVIHECYCIYKG